MQFEVFLKRGRNIGALRIFGSTFSYKNIKRFCYRANWKKLDIKGLIFKLIIEVATYWKKIIVKVLV